jgi:hypothetical protein
MSTTNNWERRTGTGAISHSQQLMLHQRSPICERPGKDPRVKQRIAKAIEMSLREFAASLACSFSRQWVFQPEI